MTKCCPPFVRRLARLRTRALAPLAVAILASACTDLATGVGEDSASARAAEIDVWWPTDGAQVSGVQPFKASLGTWKLNQYDMYWQVDGGELTYMGDSWVDGAHKEIPVDVSEFTWRGAGPYTVNFVAKDRKGNVVAERSVQVTVGGEEPTTPPGTQDSPTYSNPFAGARLYVDPYSRAQRQADEWRATRPADATQMEKIAGQPGTTWFGDWNADIRAAVADRTAAVMASGAVPVYVAYNIPVRDCSQYSGGGATSAAAYRDWIRAFARGLGTTRAVIILEPDAVAAAGCLSSAQRDERYALLADAVDVLMAQGSAVYVDAGNPNWVPAAEMAARLQRSGIARATGFSLNVSNFQTTESNIRYGTALSALVGDRRFIIDTSRNGLGPTADNQWCNPDGRALGSAPTVDTGHDLVDAFLWVKLPGESDGTCGGGPAAGQWWAEYALGLAQRAGTMVAYGG